MRSAKGTTPAHGQVGTEKTPAPLFLGSGLFLYRSPVAKCGRQRCPAKGVASSLRPKSGLTDPLELADTPSNFLEIARNPELEPPNEQTIKNIPEMYFRRM